MLELSPLPKTWIFDVDGTIVKHNGYLYGEDELLDGVHEFFQKIPVQDKIVFITARKMEHVESLKNFLNKNNIRYDTILFDMPTGERILINDNKPSGLTCAFAINKERDAALNIDFKINANL